MDMKIFPLASHRKWLIGIIFLVSVVWVITHVVLERIECGRNDFSCDNLREILFVFESGYLIKSILASLAGLIFCSERTFKWWSLFAIESIPLLVWWVIPPGGDYFDRQVVEEFSAIFFISMSVLIAISTFGYNYFVRHQKKNVETEVLARRNRGEDIHYLNRKNTLFLAFFGVIMSVIVVFASGTTGYFREGSRNFSIILSYYSGAVLLCSFILLFVRKEIFETWRKFSYIFLPLAVAFVFFTSESPTTYPLPSKETIAIFFSELFVFISLLIITIQSFRLRNTDRQ